MANKNRQMEMHEVLNELSSEIGKFVNDKTVGVGIDLEGERTINPSGSKYFMHLREERFFDKAINTDLVLLWTIKEALFKSTPENNDIVLRNFEVVSIADNSGEAICNSKDDLHYSFFSRTIDKNFVTVAICYRD